ncbi:MAG: 3-dehydroquinate synthase [Opitutales bacterium]
MSLVSHTVSLGERAYEVRVGAGASREALALAAAERAQGRVVVTVTSPGVRSALPELTAAFAAHGPLLVTQADGETAKSALELARLWEALAAAGMGRDGTLIALGGGVVGDLAGFAAATYLRGVACVQVPTTLLAMVDSSVGGKTGINLAQGKNLAGSFHQPRRVLADTDVLRHLPPREFAAGMAEVVKYGLLGDRALLSKLQAAGRISWDHPQLAEIILACVRMKAVVVAGDERETSRENGRALLNLGHTFGHAIEAVAGYGTYLHGEAVAIGITMAATLSRDLGLIAPADAESVAALLELNGLPTRLRSPLAADALLAAMGKDKKNRAGALRFVVLRALGTAATRDDVPESAVRAALRAGGAA